MDLNVSVLNRKNGGSPTRHGSHPFLHRSLVCERRACCRSSLLFIARRVVSRWRNCRCGRSLLVALDAIARCAPKRWLLVTYDNMSSSCSMKSGLVEELGLSIIPSKYVSGIKRRTCTNCTLTDVEDGSMITQMCNKEIAQLVPILVGSHT